MELFKNRPLAISTKHHKEKVMAPLLESALSVQCFVPNPLDTDVLGTFSGEIDRSLDPIATVRQKCFMAMDRTGCDLAVASEGSFHPHPMIPLVPCDEEILMFVDAKNNIEVIVKELTLETNFNASRVDTLEDLIRFADSVKFPSHGLIVKKSKDDFSNMIKGVQDYEELKTCFNQNIRLYGSCYIETDMRALYNPTRMNFIQYITHQLIVKIKSCCPKCSTPGFDIGHVIKGLPCSSCGLPTRSVLSHVYVCKQCFYQEEKLYPRGIQFELPQYCDHCNP